MTDFGLTWEYWGFWNSPMKETPNVGGAQLLIVSSAVRELFEQNKVRQIGYQRINIIEE